MDRKYVVQESFQTLPKEPSQKWYLIFLFIFYFFNVNCANNIKKKSIYSNIANKKKN